MPRPKSNYPPLHDLFVEFTRYQKRRNIAPLTLMQRRYKVASLAAYHAPTHVLRLTTDQIEAWLDSLGVSTRTRMTYISSIRVFYTWATAEARYLRTDPSRSITLPRVRRALPRPIVDEDLALALDDADPRLLAILSLMAYEGLRCVEVSRLRAEDVDHRLMTLTLHGKGDKERTVPLHPHTLEALARYRLPDRGPVFLAEGGMRKGRAPILPSTVSVIVSKHLPGRWTAHQLRHWFGTNFYRTSKDLLLTQEVMGHDRPETTSVYAKADSSKAAAVISALSVKREGWASTHPIVDRHAR